MSRSTLVLFGVLVACASKSGSSTKRNVDMSTRYVLSSRDFPNDSCIAVLFRADNGCMGSVSSSLGQRSVDFDARCSNMSQACGALIDCHCQVVDAGTRHLSLYV